jgi:importin subunit alpha-1
MKYVSSLYISLYGIWQALIITPQYLGVSTEDGRRRREQNVSAIRKDKKEEGLAKRRNISSDAPESESHVIEEGSSPEESDKKRVYSAADIPSLLMGLQSSELSSQVDSLRGFRRLLSLEKNAPVKQCIACGALPLFVQFLQRSDSTELQFEAAWVLTNIASSDETKVFAASIFYIFMPYYHCLSILYVQS